MGAGEVQTVVSESARSQMAPDSEEGLPNPVCTLAFVFNDWILRAV